MRPLTNFAVRRSRSHPLRRLSKPTRMFRQLNFMETTRRDITPSRPEGKATPVNLQTGQLPPAEGLYDPEFEHDACGVGFVANIKGVKSHDIIVKRLESFRKPRASRRDGLRPGNRRRRRNSAANPPCVFCRAVSRQRRDAARPRRVRGWDAVFAADYDGTRRVRGRVRNGNQRGRPNLAGVAQCAGHP